MTTLQKVEKIGILLPPRAGLRITRAGFRRLCSLNPDLRLERTARGELIVMPPAGSDTGGRNARLTMHLAIWAEADGTGAFFDSSAGFTLPNGAIRAPDASWILKARWEAISPAARKGFAPICPDFVVELRSPSDRLEEVRDKMREYLEQGARLGWLIDPIAGSVTVYRPGHLPEELARPDSVSGEDVLPGFVMRFEGILGD